ncbi:MAG: membrane protein insertion efficiency factor YidD [Rhodospirillales bacterium]
MALLRPVMLALIHAYRLLVSPILPLSCRFEPTCSAYGLEAVRRFGGLAGGWLILRRLGRCHPWGGCGYDPVPEAAPGRGAGRAGSIAGGTRGGVMPEADAAR